MSQTADQSDTEFNAQQRHADQRDELDAKIDKMLMWNIDGHTEPVIFQPEMKAAIKKLIAARLRAQLDELEVEGPKRMTPEDALASGWIDDEYRAFNQSSAQWRALLARKRKEKRSYEM